MADLYHLLDEIQQPQERVLDENDYDNVDNSSLERNEDDREQVELPTFPPPSASADKDGVLLDEELIDSVEKTGEASNTPYTMLREWWKQELNCSELLPYNHELFESLVQTLEEQEGQLEEQAQFTGNADLDSLLSSIVRMDLDRVKFMLADITQARLQKIQEHPLHMRTMVDRMSEAEVRQFLCLSIYSNVRWYAFGLTSRFNYTD
jgi:hypothetical protein